MRFLQDFAPSDGERRVALSGPGSRGANGLPDAQGLYDPAHEHDACGLGFVADLRRPPTHEVVSMGLEILKRLAHRGAAGCDPCSSDGAGILIHVPHVQFERVLARIGVELPLEGDYGVAQCFLSRDPATRAKEMRTLEDAVRSHGQKVIAWRDVPIDATRLGPMGRESLPSMKQLFIGRMCPAPIFERTLFMIRKRAGRRATEGGLPGLYRKPVFEDHRLQGLGLARAPGCVLPRSSGRVDAQQGRARAFAVQHEHVPDLGARAPLPLHRAQR